MCYANETFFGILEGVAIPDWKNAIIGMRPANDSVVSRLYILGQIQQSAFSVHIDKHDPKKSEIKLGNSEINQPNYQTLLYYEQMPKNNSWSLNLYEATFANVTFKSISVKGVEFNAGVPLIVLPF